MIRRFLTRLFVLTLIAGCVYNWMQTRLLQAQVAALEAQAAQPKRTLVITRAPEEHSHLYSLQGQWKRLQNQAGALRSTSKKVLSYVNLEIFL